MSVPFHLGKGFPLTCPFRAGFFIIPYTKGVNQKERSFAYGKTTDRTNSR